jgi:Ca-activated chloride channel homolog
MRHGELKNFFRLFFLLLVCACFSHAQEEDVIKIDSSIVVVNAVVTDKNGNPILGLKRNDFRLFVDGVEESVASFSAEETPFAAVILIDTSGSMEGRISLARSAAISFLDGLRSEDVVAIYNFDSKFSMIQDFSNGRDIADAIFDLSAKGMTILNDAIYEASKLLAGRQEKRRAIIVLSDGADTRSKTSTDKALKTALEANALIYTVDMSPINATGREKLQNQGVLRFLAEKSGGFFIETPGGQALRDAFKKIVTELGNQYTLTFQLSESRMDGKWHTIEVKVNREGARVRARKGFNAPPVK